MLKGILKGLSKVENGLIAALFAFNLAILFVTVVMRYVFNNSPTWPEEASRYVMIWIIYLGVSQSIEKNSEIKIDVLTKLIPSRWVETFTSIFATCVGLIISGLIAVVGFQFTGILMETEQVAASFSIPMWAMYLIVPISGVLMGIKYIIKFIGMARGSKASLQLDNRAS